MISWLKSLFAYPVLLVSAVVLLVVRGIGWLLLLGGMLTVVVWLAGGLQVTGWLILAPTITGAALLAAINLVLSSVEG